MGRPNATKVFSVHEAKSQLSKLLAMVEAGEDIIIACNQRPVVRLVRFEDRPARRQWGQDKGKFQVGDDFSEPLPPDWQEAWHQ